MIIMSNIIAIITIAFHRIHVRSQMVQLRILSGCIRQVKQTDI